MARGVLRSNPRINLLNDSHAPSINQRSELIARPLGGEGHSQNGEGDSSFESQNKLTERLARPLKGGEGRQGLRRRVGRKKIGNSK